MIKSPTRAKPFLKWAGGKTQLLPKIKEYMPKEVVEGKVINYVEPFVGSGAVLFELMQSEEYQFEKAHIWDINPELINVYKVIKSPEVVQLISHLKVLDEEYNYNEDKDYRKKIYMRIRSNFNEGIHVLEKNPSMDFRVKRASEFIFLNRTCYNGLYRVNKKGEFNVPMGSYKKPKICDESNLLEVHELLKRVVVHDPGDYRESRSIIDEILSSGQKVFVYFDPPYRPLNASSSFTSYSKFDFNEHDQIKLSVYFKELDKLGAYLMLSNSDPKNINENDDFFDKEHYFKRGENGENLFHIHRVHARRNINSKGSKRGKITELLITN